MRSFAINALTAGITDLTATSHGSIKWNSPFDLFRLEKYLNMTYVILIMTYVMTGSKWLKLSFWSDFDPFSKPAVTYA